MQRVLFKNSFIYTSAVFLQKGVLFLLLPVYLKYLTKEEFGTVALVQSLAAILSVFFTLGLDAAIMRFYHDRDNADKFRELFGTLLVSILILSLTAFVLSATLLSPLIAYILSSVEFFPTVFIGLAILLFQPVYNLSLSYLQAKGAATQYVVLNMLYFISNVSLTIALIIFMDMGAVGYLTAILGAQFIAAITGLILLRKEYIICFRWTLLQRTISYSSHFIPHMLFGQTTAYVDRIILNRYFDQARVGVYQLAYVLSTPLEIVSGSINRAFSPLYFKNITGSDQDKSRIIDSSYFIILLYFIAVSALSFFCFEILYLFFGPEYLKAYRVVPWIGFAFVNNGLYYFFSYPLFFDKKLTRFLPICTVTAGACVIAMDFILIPKFGIVGAGVAMFVGQGISALLVLYFSRGFMLLKWPLARISGGYVLTLSGVATVMVLNEWMAAFDWWFVALKLLLLMLIALGCVKIFFGRISVFYDKLLFLRKVKS